MKKDRIKELGMGRDILGEFELVVMLAAMRLGQEQAYALAIVDDIKERTERRVRRSAVYMTLQRLEEKGYITTHLGEPRAERGGKARRLVHIEAAGTAAVSHTKSSFERMWGGLDFSVEQS